MLPQLLANGFAAGCLLALSAAGFWFVQRTTRVFHLAHGAVYAAAAYACYVLTAKAGCPWLIAALGAVAAAAGLGLLVECLVYAPLARRGASALVALISSLGVYIVVVNLIAMGFGNQTLLLSVGAAEPAELANVRLTRFQAAQVVAAVVLLGSVAAWLRLSELGKTIRAAQDQPALAVALGVRLWRIRAAVFAIGSALAGAAGALQALDVGIDPHMGMTALLGAAVATTVGGHSRLSGAVAGGLVLGLFQNLLLGVTANHWVEAITFLTLLAVLVFRPRGLLGGGTRVEEAE